MPQENKDWKEEWNKFARADFENARNELIDNPELTESSDAYFGYMVRKENELFRVVDFGNIKTFIQSLLDKQRNEVIKLLSQDIGMLRQWLNEDRITDTKKMVTNEEIKVWFKNLTEIKKG